MTGIPRAAITDARDAIANIRDRGATSIDMARAALEAAAPLIAAVERERCARLAEQAAQIWDAAELVTRDGSGMAGVLRDLAARLREAP